MYIPVSPKLTSSALISVLTFIFIRDLSVCIVDPTGSYGTTMALQNCPKSEMWSGKLTSAPRGLSWGGFRDRQRLGFSEGWQLRPDHLQVPSPVGCLAALKHDGGISWQTPQQSKGDIQESWVTPMADNSKVTQHHFCHSLRVEAVTEKPTQVPGEGTESSSCWRSGKALAEQVR